MFYLSIDQHRNQITISLGDESGNELLHRQVSTRFSELEKFLTQVVERSGEEGFVVILEVCGFNDYLIKLLRGYGCRQVVLVQPERRDKRKTDRRDARKLREALWANRDRLLSGQRIHGLRRVRIASAEEAADRQITGLRQKLTRLRTRITNRVHGILMKHNLQHDCPTKTIRSIKARHWLSELDFPEVDRLEIDLLLKQWQLLDTQISHVELQIKSRSQQRPAAVTIASIPGISHYGSLAISSRISRIEDFPRGESLANFLGLTPSCRNSGKKQHNPGSITKEGSPMVRHLLGQALTHTLRKDAWLRHWYQRIKRRRGTKIARVAVMRHLATVIWSMLRYQVPYVTGGPDAYREVRQRVETLQPATSNP